MSVLAQGGDDPGPQKFSSPPTPHDSSSPGMKNKGEKQKKSEEGNRALYSQKLKTNVLYDQ